VPPLQFPSSSLPRKVGGYDRDATVRLFENLASSYERLWLECSELRERLSSLETTVAGFEDEKRLLASAFVEVRESGATLIAEARHDAEAMLSKARKKADAIVAQAEREARGTAARIASEAEADRAQLEAEVARLRGFAGETYRELSSFLLAALERSIEAANGKSPGDERPDLPAHVGDGPAGTWAD
jgi:cell division septum initiation protein DivIVA